MAGDGPAPVDDGTPSINDVMSRLMKARDLPIKERNACLAQIVAHLVDKYLRDQRAAEHDIGRAVKIIGHLASKSMGTFDFGEASAVGPTALALLQHLAEPSEERQATVVTALEQVLLLLRMSSPRTLACVGREAVALCASLSSAPLGPLRAFDEFASMCSGGDGDLPPATLMLDSAERVAWARLGLFRLCARLHAACPQFLGDGGPQLWEAALSHLLPPLPAARPPAPEPARAGEREAADGATLMAVVDALRGLLASLACPLPVRSRLLYRLLQLLTVEIAPCADATPDSPPALPWFRSAELDTAIGASLHALTRRSVPPLDALPLLSLAVPHALAASPSTALHGALCALLCTLPADALDGQLRPMEGMLGVAALQPALLPCFERALRLQSPASSEPPPRSRASDGGRRDAADVDDADAENDGGGGGDDDGGGGGGDDGDDGDGGGVDGNDSRPAKRRRLPPASSLRHRLFTAAMGLGLGEGDAVDVRSLSLLGATACLLAPSAASLAGAAETRGAHGAPCAAGGAAEATDLARAWLEPLLHKLEGWLSRIVAMGSEAPERVGSRWQPRLPSADGDWPMDETAAESSQADGPPPLLPTSLRVCGELLRRASALPSALPPPLVRAIGRLASLAWAPPAGTSPPPPAERTAGGDEAWSSRFSPALRSRALRLLALLPAAAPADGRVACFTLAIARCAPAAASDGSADGAADDHDAAELEVGATALGELPGLVLSMRISMGEILPSLTRLATACPTVLVGPLARCIGALACIQGGQTLPSRGDRHAIGSPQRPAAPPSPSRSCLDSWCCDAAVRVRCTACDSPAPASAARHRPDGEGAEGGVLGAADGSIPGGTTGAAAGTARLFSLMPLLWERLDELPPANGAARGALLLGMARVVRHAHTTELARSPELLVPLLSMLSDEQPETRAACEASLPRLLGHPPFVRSVAGITEDDPLSPATLIESMIHPMADAMAEQQSDPAVRLSMVRTLGALGVEPLYSSDLCRAAIVLVLAQLLSAGEQPSTEHSLGLQLVEAIARAPQALTAGGRGGRGGGGSEASGASAGTIVSLCHRLAPHLAPECIWWASTRPQLFTAVARSLYDTDEAALLALLAPRAVPRLVLVGGLAGGNGSPPAPPELVSKLCGSPGHANYGRWTWSKPPGGPAASPARPAGVVPTAVACARHPPPRQVSSPATCSAGSRRRSASRAGPCSSIRCT